MNLILLFEYDFGESRGNETMNKSWHYFIHIYKSFTPRSYFRDLIIKSNTKESIRKFAGL